MGRRTIETAEISEIYLCVYTFPQRPYLATYDMRLQGCEVKGYEYFRCMEAEVVNQDMDNATKNSDILEDLQDDWNTLCDMEMSFLWLPWYAYPEKHSDDDDDNEDDLSNDMIRSNAENHKTATGVKALRTVSCAALLHIAVIILICPQ